MGIAIFNNLQSKPSYSHHHYSSSFLLSSTSSMSQDYHNQDTGGEAAAAAAAGGGGGGGVGIFSFSSSDNNGFHPTPHHHHHHMSHQIRRDKLRDQAEYHSTNPSSLVGIHDVQEEDSASLNHHHQVNETTGMLSEMFNFAPGGPVPTAVDLLEHQTSLSRQPIDSGDWYGGRQGMVIDGLGEADSKSHHNNQNRDSSNYSQGQHHHHTISGSINADAAAAMQLFLSNPPPRSPSPSPHHHSSSTLHMLLPDPHQQTSVLHHAYAGGGGGGGGGISPSQFSWIPGPPTAASEIGGVVEGQGLSLSLSSSLQHLEAAKAEELRIGDGGVFYYNQPGQAVAAAAQSSSSAAQYYRQQQQVLHQQQQQNHHHQVHVSGLGSGLGVMNVLRHSKYVKAAQELLEEFCSVGRGQFKKNKSLARLNSSNSNNGGGGGGGGGSSEKDQLPLPPLSSSDRMEHQRRKVKLVSMLDEVDRRYNHYCEQMQMVVNSFDLVMGFGAAVPYTALAQKAMSRHFRCLKDAIAGQLKQSCEMLGEKESGGAGGSSAGITRGETPRLKALEQSLRQQRAFHQMGMMEQEAWRPQRGLPERSVNILRAWLFEHFLHPYPSDADKHLLARQTGLSRNQVSNWFINARVRLWKPMIEDMYQQEAKEAADDDDDEDDTSQDREHDQLHTNSQTPPPPPTTILNSNADMSSSAVGTTTQAAGIISGIGEENDPCSSSLIPINTHCFSENQASTTTTTTTTTNINTGGATMLSSAADFPFHDFADDTTCHRRSGASGIIAPDYGGTSVGNHHHLHLHHVSVHDQSLIGPNTTTTTTNTTAAPPMQIRYGTTAAAGGDVSLTLGLRHAGNMPENASSAFSIRDFGDC